VFEIGDAPDWAYRPNLAADHPLNKHRIECLTEYHPNGTAFRIRRTGTLLDPSGSLPLRQIVMRLKAWQRVSRRKRKRSQRANAGAAPTAEELAALRVAIKQAGGNKAPPKLLIVATDLAMQRKRIFAGLRQLEKIGEYHGFSRRPRESRTR